ncbi:MAG: MBOAT family protein [Clostridia bacterium]|nr:MBOAT family protein [Clostridia bacterium]
MTFNSITFLIFFAIVALLLLITKIDFKIKKEKMTQIRHIILLLSSYVFYGWWNWKCAILMLVLTYIAYWSSLRVDKTNSKIYLAIGIVFPLVILGVFKYYNFFVDSFCYLFGISKAGTLNIILPVGISFYTFQSMSYTMDVYRRHIDCEKSYVKLALYIAFFPQLVAGPIVKAKDFIYQLYEDRNINWTNFKEGIQIFVFGLFKKIVIADNISVFVDAVFNMPQKFHAVSIILAVIGYSIQIYCDFSGYSDMAIGSAKILGYDLTRNFNMPYVAKNISVFWKRWHISLSTWLQEYLYISLGGNRKGEIRTYVNLFLTMLIGGLWHGASWTFVVWGAFHGIALCIHKVWMKLSGHDKNYKGTPVGNFISIVITYIFVCFCWIFFRAESFETAKDVIMGIVNWQDGIFFISSWTIFGIECVLISTIVAWIRSRIKKTDIQGFYLTVNLETIWGLVVLFVAFGLCFSLAYTGSSPFIYFQF